MTNGYQGKQFQSAAFRRGGQPLTFQWQDWPIDEDGNPAPEPVEVVLMVDPLLDVIRVGAAFGGFAQALQAFGQPGSDIEALLPVLETQVPKVKKALRDCLTPPSRLKWDKVEASIELTEVSKIVRWLMSEMSGLDPTQPVSSQTGLPPTGNGSTAGAPPVALTPPPSPTAGA